MRKGADLLSKWVGEAEKQLRLLFEEASKHQPAIIFFDEIDGLAPVRVCAWVCARVCVYVGDVVWYLGAGRFRTLVWLRVEGASYNPCCVVCQTRQLPRPEHTRTTSTIRCTLTVLAAGPQSFSQFCSLLSAGMCCCARLCACIYAYLPACLPD